METEKQSTRNETPISLAHSYSIDEIFRISTAYANSGYFKNVTMPEQAFTKILAGQELGVGPMTAMSMIHMVDGKATMDATLVGAQIKKSGRYDYRILQSDDLVCIIEFSERGKLLGTASFTWEKAKRAGLTSKYIWKAYPEDMLRSRTMTRGAKMYCPDVFNGAIYTPEELGADIVNDELTVITPQETSHNSRALDEATSLARESKMKAIIEEICARLGYSSKSKQIYLDVFQKIATFAQLDTVPDRLSGFDESHLSSYLEQLAKETHST